MATKSRKPAKGIVEQVATMASMAIPALVERGKTLLAAVKLHSKVQDRDLTPSEFVEGLRQRRLAATQRFGWNHVQAPDSSDADGNPLDKAYDSLTDEVRKYTGLQAADAIAFLAALAATEPSKWTFRVRKQMTGGGNPVYSLMPTQSASDVDF